MNVVTENVEKASITINVSELEAIIQRVVREEMRRHSDRIVREIIEFWRHEGPPDLEGDEILAREALEQIEKHGDDYSNCITLEELKAELAAETNGIHSQSYVGGA